LARQKLASYPQKQKGRHVACASVTASVATVSRLVRCAGLARTETKLNSNYKDAQLRELQILLRAELHLAGCDFGDYRQPILNFQFFQFAVA